jgi:hypothetical protein
VKKQIFWDDTGNAYGPDVVNFPEFCALNRWIYDSRGQVDMNSAIAAAVTKAFEEKKLFILGPFGLRTDGGIPPVIEAMWEWSVVNLGRNRLSKVSKKSENILKKAGYDLSGWKDI